MYNEIVGYIRELFGTDEFIPLHEPCFTGNERLYVNDALDSTFVSSVGKYVDIFENMMAKITGSKYAVAVVNGTSALHTALLLADVKAGDEVICQPLTFVATANAITYTGAQPVFTDVDKDTLGLSPSKLKDFLAQNLVYKKGSWINRQSGNRVAACVPVHTFGLPARIDDIISVCKEYHLPVIEDGAESLGSTLKKQHTGSFGNFGIFSFNGNKTVTSGGGGAIITDDPVSAKKAKHITTTAKKDHKWEYNHDQIGYNYRMPNLNAALACAQLEMLDLFVKKKRTLAKEYSIFFESTDIKYIRETKGAKSNYWLNSILFSNRDQRNEFLAFSNNRNIMTRPAWKLLNKLPMFSECVTGNLDNAKWLEDRLVNIPSSVRIDE